MFSTFRFLAGGPYFERYAADNYRISKTSSSRIILATCLAIYEELSKTEVMEYNQRNWLEVAKGFNDKWNMPNCVGAIDGKHVKIKRPRNSGSLYYNSKVCRAFQISDKFNWKYELNLVFLIICSAIIV